MEKITVKVGKMTRRAKFAQALKNVAPGTFEVLTNFDKPTGNWLQILLSDGQLLIVNSGELAQLQADGLEKIFEDETLEEGAEVTFLPNLLIGVKGGNIVFAQA